MITALIENEIKYTWAVPLVTMSSTRGHILKSIAEVIFTLIIGLNLGKKYKKLCQVEAYND
jgi:hypothetical protein